MAKTGDEADRPGSNYPDDGNESAEKAVAAPGTQNAPVMDMHDTTDEARLAGVVDQTRADAQQMGFDHVERLLRERVEQVGLDLSEDDLRALAERIVSGG